MLINAQSAEQVRVAVLDGTELKDYQVEISDRGLCRGNIYRGIVANIQPSLNAAFIDIGEDRHGFLSMNDLLPAAYHHKTDDKRPRIEKVLERGRPLLVQVTKDGVNLKGAALSTNVALAGRYLVLTPFDSVRGVSRKAEDDVARKKIRERLKKLNLPSGHGVIVRTNGLDQNQTTLNRDLSALLRLWKRVRDEGDRGKGPRLLYSDQDLIVQSLRDYLDTSIAQVIVDDDSAYEKAHAYMQAFMPRSKTKLIRYAERLPLFSRYNLEDQIDRIYERTAPLPSGGSIVIDSTEALTAIDVNSGRATKHGNHDESILAVNMEAAREVARQLRLRDIGGLVVVDFIDMRTRRHQSKLEKAMRDAMKDDKARYSVGRISSNGLLEINRQRIKQALRLRTHRSCPTCQGSGSIPNPEFAAAALLGRIEARVANGLIEGVTAAVHPEIAEALQNGYRARLAALEEEFDLHIKVLGAPNFSHDKERIDWQHREKAVRPKAPAALTSSDLTLPGRKRRRSRSRRGADEPAAEAEQAQAAAATADTASDQAGSDRDERATGDGRKRSRRGGKRRNAGEEGVAADASDGRRRSRRGGKRRDAGEEGVAADANDGKRSRRGGQRDADERVASDAEERSRRGGPRDADDKRDAGDAERARRGGKGDADNERVAADAEQRARRDGKDDAGDERAADGERARRDGKDDAGEKRAADSEHARRDGDVDARDKRAADNEHARRDGEDDAGDERVAADADGGPKRGRRSGKRDADNERDAAEAKTARQPDGDGERPAQSRRRRRGGRRRRKPADKRPAAQDAQPPDNVGNRYGDPTPAAAAGKRGKRPRRGRGKKGNHQPYPHHQQQGNVQGEHPPDPDLKDLPPTLLPDPSTRRVSPLRRDRSSQQLRWQWWGGSPEDPVRPHSAPEPGGDSRSDSDDG